MPLGQFGHEMSAPWTPVAVTVAFAVVTATAGVARTAAASKLRRSATTGTRIDKGQHKSLIVLY
jgi:hypothetical protein